MVTPKLIFGAGLFSKEHGAHSADDARPWVEPLLDSKAKGLVNEIDTAVAYQQSEEYLGQLGLGSHFAIATKVPGGAHPTQPATKETVVAQTEESLRKLLVEQLDILYIHAPDARIPLEDTLAGINTLYKAGKFKRFGLSNYTPEQVEEVIKICNEKGFILPSVFQGSYNAFARSPEDKLLPLLRRNNIAFYAYSPIAGGFIAKTSQQFRDNSLQGRWSPDGLLGMVYRFMYDNPAALEALDKWHEIAADEGISSVEMAYRWVVYNSALDGSLGDGIVIGASSIEQWKSNLAAIDKGPLKKETAAKINGLWNPDVNSVLDNWEAIKGAMAAKQQGAPK